MIISFYSLCLYSSVFAFQSLSPFKVHLWNFLFLSSLPAPDHSRSEMDLSAPGSEHSDDALSLRSRSVPGFNETVSSVTFSSFSYIPMHWSHIWFLWNSHTVCFFFFFKAIHLLSSMSISSSGSVGWWTQHDASDWMLISLHSSHQRASKQL